MENESLLLSYGLVIAALLISFYNHLKIEKEIVTSSIRATLQLIVVGFLLEAILNIERPVYLFLILMFMSVVAGVISGNRGREIPGSHWIAFLGITIGSIVTFAILYTVGVIQPGARRPAVLAGPCLHRRLGHEAPGAICISGAG